MSAAAFSPDGKRLATGSVDTNILVWDVARVLKPAPPPAASRPGAKELEVLWKTLAAEDAVAAAGCRGAIAFARRGGPVPRQRSGLPRQQTRSASTGCSPPSTKRFVERQKAGLELEKLGPVAAPALRKLLATEVPLEARQRAEALMQKVDGPVTNADLLRDLRAVEALERMGTPEADAVLRVIAGGADGHPLTEEAREALAPAR